MSNISVIILAAGDSRRFAVMGYDTPKPFLTIDYAGQKCSMLGHVLLRVEKFANSVLVVTRMNQELPSDIYNIHCPLDHLQVNFTLGQADTLRKALVGLPEQSVMVLDCDMLLPEHDLEYLAAATDLYEVAVAVARTFDPNASTVDQIPFPTQFREKECASEWGIVGARAFRSVKHLRAALEEYVVYCGIYLHSEPFLTPAINYIKGKKFAHVVGDYVDWGTPQRLQESGAVII